MLLMPSQEASKKLKKNDFFEYGLFGEKALDFLANSDAWINICYGSVRSGKTITMNVRWLHYLFESPHSEFLMSGKTSKTLERNAVKPLEKMLNNEGLKHKYSSYHGTLKIEDKTVWCLGFNDEKSVDVIAGMTVGGWYADEIARCPQSAVEMAISRCSADGALMFWNTNPDSPYHYIYTNYINNQELLNSGTVKNWHFTLDDNPNLSSKYITELKRVNQKSQVFYKRNILGEWVIAEGAIYDHFVESENTFNTSFDKRRYHKINICCDYGVSTVTTFGVMGIIHNESMGNVYHLIEETYYDAEEQGVQQSDSDRVNDLVRLQNKYELNENNTIYLPHDAGSLKVACEKDQRIKMCVETYTPNTYEDIVTIQNLISTNRFLIHESCTNSINQAQTYSWDVKAQRRGEDRPLKINDHCPDMWRGGIIGPRNSTKPELLFIDL